MDIPRIGDRVLGWNSGRLLVNQIPVTGVVSVDAEETREVEVVYGQKKSGKPIGITPGKYSAKPITARMLLDEWASATGILPSIALLGLGSYGSAVFAVQYTLFELLNPQLTVALAWEGCQIIGQKLAFAEGVEAAMIDVTMQPLGMLMNGLPLYDPTRDLSL